jgi:hypothetical protein
LAIFFGSRKWHYEQQKSEKLSLTKPQLVGKGRKILIPQQTKDGKHRERAESHGSVMNPDFFRSRNFPFVLFCDLSRCYKRNLHYFSPALLENWKRLQNQSFSNKRDYKIPAFSTRPQD